MSTPQNGSPLLTTNSATVDLKPTETTNGTVHGLANGGDNVSKRDVLIFN